MSFELNSDRRLATEVNQIRQESEHLQRLAMALVRAESTQKVCEAIVEECLTALEADAICIYLLTSNGYYEMAAERNCTQRFKEEWFRIYPEKVPLLRRRKESHFSGSADEFKQHVANSESLVDHSRRKEIAYAPLMVGSACVAILGYSYNGEHDEVSPQFVANLAKISAEAIARARLFDHERKARLDAESANKAKTKFLTSISHEIRAPISAIRGFAELLDGVDGLHSKKRNWISRILKNAEHLSGLVGDVLDISKIEADKTEVCHSVFSLKELFEDVKAVTLFKAEEKNITLHFENVRDEIEVYSDPVHLRQLLINLIGNAIKFTPQNGKVEVGYQFKNSVLRFDVKDTGIGIAPENHERIFDPFMQVEGQGSALGSGLGLYISKRLTTALGGELKLQESEINKGSWFVAELTCEEPPIDSKIRFKNQEISLRGLSILIVDDSDDIRDLVKYHLVQEGAKVDTARNGLIGIAKASEKAYDVIIMDIQMPELDGNQTISRLRSRGYKKPVVALTAEALAHQKEESLQRGFDKYLTKPINREQLIGTLIQLTR